MSDQPPIMPDPWVAPQGPLRTIDDEFIRIGNIMAILDPLSQMDINRILAYLVSRYQVNPGKEP